MLFFVLVLHLFLFWDSIESQRIPENPCKDIFSYRNDNGFHYGEVTLPYDGRNQLDFSMNVSMVGLYNDQNLNIKLDLLTKTEDIRPGTKLLYRVDFPIQTVIPKVTQIEYNHQIYCSGPPEPLSIEGVTSLWASLTHFLPVGVNEPVINTPIEPPIPTPTPTKPSPIFIPTPPTTPPTVYTPPSTTKRRRIIPTSFPQRDSVESCGQTNSVQQLILGGTNITRNEVPWLVAMLRHSNGEIRFQCTCNLISDQHIVTAAHCVRNMDKDSFIFVMGEVNLTQWATSSLLVRRTAEKITVHPNARENSADGDIAVIKFNQRVEFSDSLKPICLWTGNRDITRFISEEGTVAGWGKDESDRKSVPWPKKVRMPIVSEADCLRDSVAFINLTAKDLTFCAGKKNGQGPCTGDSGGGFILRQNSRYFLRGIVSYALSYPNNGGCNLEKYVVFVDTAVLVDWIKTAMT